MRREGIIVEIYFELCCCVGHLNWELEFMTDYDYKIFMIKTRLHSIVTTHSDKIKLPPFDSIIRYHSVLSPPFFKGTTVVCSLDENVYGHDEYSLSDRHSLWLY